MKDKKMQKDSVGKEVSKQEAVKKRPRNQKRENPNIVQESA